MLEDEDILEGSDDSSPNLLEEFNAALDFVLDENPDEPLEFLRLWREGGWVELDAGWPEFRTFCEERSR